ncbi:hypothetical protein OAT67_05385 [Bacteriovoracaceae bacterium]|nr:hypothetical protein [Bacteriovoracaceae bacterium]
MVKKVVLPPKKKKDLEGFEEAIDLITGEKTTTVEQKKDQLEDYQIYDYLLKENERLKKVDDLFSTKLKILEKYDQIETLIKEQQDSMAMCREELIATLNVKNSNYMLSMDEFFRKVVK